jgi:MFS family permease
MVVLRAFFALAAGLAVSAALIALLDAWLRRRVPEWSDQAKKLVGNAIFVNLAASFLAAAAGGYTTAWIAAHAPMQHVLALGVIVLVLAAVSAMQARGKLPIAYALALVVVTPLGVLAGGLLRLRVLGIL